MYILQKLNVEKHTDDENMRDKLIAQGYKLLVLEAKNTESKDEVKETVSLDEEKVEEKPVKEKKPKK